MKIVVVSPLDGLIIASTTTHNPGGGVLHDLQYREVYANI